MFTSYRLSDRLELQKFLIFRHLAQLGQTFLLYVLRAEIARMQCQDLE